MSITRDLRRPNDNDLAQKVQSAIEDRSFRILAVLIWAACTLPTMFLLLPVAVGRVLGETIPHTPTTQAFRYALIIAVLLWASITASRRGAELLSRPFGVVIVLAIAIAYPSASGYFHADGNLDELFTALVSLIVVLAVFSLKLTVQSLSIIGGLGALTGLLSLAMAWLRPQSAFVLEGGGQALAGPFNNSNYLGTVLVLSLPFALLIKNRLYRVFSIVLISLPILMGGSNTGIVTLGVFVLLGLVILFVKSASGRALFVGIAGGCAFAVTLVLPYVIHDPQALSRRGAIWSLASTQMLDFIPFGAGEVWYETNSALVGFFMDHGHNLLLDPLIIGGLPYFGAVLLLLLLLFQFGVRLISFGGSVAPAMYTVTLMLAGGAGELLYSGPS